MHIINTRDRKFKSQIPNPNGSTPLTIGTERSRSTKSQIPITKHNRSGKLVMGYWLLFGYWLLVIGVLPGCIQSSNIEKTQEYIRQSESYYRQAIQEYKDLIVKGKDLDRLYLELGKVYFSRGDFAQAVEALKKSQDIQAKKFLAITYYRLGDFTAALEIFDKR